MTRLLFLLLLVPMFSINARSQSFCDFFKTDSVTWYGVDFSRARFAGPGFNNPLEIKNTFLKAWNILILNEPEKYNLWYFFDKSYVDFNLDPVLKRNSQIDEKKLVTYDLASSTLKAADIDNIISEYDFQRDRGFGLLLIVDSYNNFEETGYFHIVFIDNKSKKVILSKEISGPARGIGLRNYWAGAIYNALVKLPLMNWKKELCKAKKN